VYSPRDSGATTAGWAQEVVRTPKSHATQNATPARSGDATPSSGAKQKTPRLLRNLGGYEVGATGFAPATTCTPRFDPTRRRLLRPPLHPGLHPSPGLPRGTARLQVFRDSIWVRQGNAVVGYVSAFKAALPRLGSTGMRKGEILNLRWSQLDLKAGTIRLGAEDTKTKKARTIYLTARALEVLRKLPRQPRSDQVFVNPSTGKGWVNMNGPFEQARKAIGRPDLWFHDLRRSFVTNARRRGVPESVVMKMSGHRTRSVFDRYNVIEDEDVKAAVRTIEAGQIVVGKS
jgi:hypothetical protein